MSDPAGTARSVLIVEDDEATAELERRVLVRSGLNVRRVSRVSDAIELLSSTAFRVVVLDYQLPDGDPWSVVATAILDRLPHHAVTLNSRGNS